MQPSVARDILGKRGWLAATPEGFRNAVLKRCGLRTVGRDEPVYRRDDPPGGLWGLASGGLAIEVEPLDRGAMLGHFAGPGYWIGAAPLVTGSTRQVGLVATRPSVLLHLPIAEFEAIAAGDPQAWRWLAILPIQQTMLATGVAEDLMIRDPRRRLLATLLRLAALRGPFAGTEPQDIMVSQENLASIVNLSRTAVGQMLRAFEVEGLIDRRYSSIRIVNTEAAASLIAQTTLRRPNGARYPSPRR